MKKTNEIGQGLMENQLNKPKAVELPNDLFAIIHRLLIACFGSFIASSFIALMANMIFDLGIYGYFNFSVVWALAIVAALNNRARNERYYRGVKKGLYLGYKPRTSLSIASKYLGFTATLVLIFLVLITLYMVFSNLNFLDKGFITKEDFDLVMANHSVLAFIHICEIVVYYLAALVLRVIDKLRTGRIERRSIAAIIVIVLALVFFGTEARAEGILGLKMVDGKEQAYIMPDGDPNRNKHNPNKGLVLTDQFKTNVLDWGNFSDNPRIVEATITNITGHDIASMKAKFTVHGVPNSLSRYKDDKTSRVATIVDNTRGDSIFKNGESIKAKFLFDKDQEFVKNVSDYSISFGWATQSGLDAIIRQKKMEKQEIVNSIIERKLERSRVKYVVMVYGLVIFIAFVCIKALFTALTVRFKALERKPNRISLIIFLFKKRVKDLERKLKPLKR